MLAPEHKIATNPAIRGTSSRFGRESRVTDALRITAAYEARCMSNRIPGSESVRVLTTRHAQAQIMSMGPALYKPLSSSKLLLCVRLTKR